MDAFVLGFSFFPVVQSSWPGTSLKHFVRDENLLDDEGELVPSAVKTVELLLSLTRPEPFGAVGCCDPWLGFDGFEIGAVNFCEVKDWNVVFFSPKLLGSGLLARLDTYLAIGQVKQRIAEAGGDERESKRARVVALTRRDHC